MNVQLNALHSVLNIFKLSISKNKSLACSLCWGRALWRAGVFYEETQSECGSEDREMGIHVASQEAAFS